MPRPLWSAPLVTLGLLLGAGPGAPACTFCGGSVTSRLTLRELYRTHAVVLHGRLMNPKFDPAGGSSTEFRVGVVLKGDGVAPGMTLTIPRYFPLLGDTPPDTLIFGGFDGGRFDAVQGAPAPPAIVPYLREMAALPESGAGARIELAARRLDAAEPAIRNDAFLELAKAADRDLFAARGSLRPDVLRRRLDDPTVPNEQIGLFALLLGVGGAPADAARFERWLAPAPPLPDAVADNLGGILAGFVRLAPAQAWLRIEAMLSEGGRPISERLSAVNTVRFFNANDPESRGPVRACYRAVLRQGDLADLAVEELRRGKVWEMAPEVMACYGLVPPAPPLLRRAIVRYALSCPEPAAKQLVESARSREPKLVADVEEGLRLLEGR